MTVMAHQRTAVHKLLEEVGGLPVIVKLLQGTQGIGVMIAHHPRGGADCCSAPSVTWGTTSSCSSLSRSLAGRDVRAFVVGDRVVAAIAAHCKEGESSGPTSTEAGRGAPIELSDDEARNGGERGANRRPGGRGRRHARGRGGPLVLEVNSSPGFEGIEAATRLDVAGTIIRHAAQFALDQMAGVRKQRVI